jgi:hypothetical protein
MVWMLGFLTRKRRWRAASLLVVLYALSLAAPTTVLAIGKSGEPAQCQTERHHGTAATHDHQDGSNEHRSDTSGGDHDQTSKCCGLFLVSAVAPDVDFVTRQHPPVARLGLLSATDLSGQDTDRIDRPPRSLPSL